MQQWGMVSTSFSRGVLPPGVKHHAVAWVDWRFRGPCHLHPQGKRICQASNWSESRWQTDSNCFLLRSFFWSKEVTYSSKTWLHLQWNAWPYIPEDTLLHKQCCENLKSYSILDCTLHNTFCPESLSCWKTCSFLVFSRMLFVSRAMRAAQRFASLLKLTTADAWSAVTFSTVSLSHGSKSYWMCCLSTG